MTSTTLSAPIGVGQSATVTGPVSSSSAASPAGSTDITPSTVPTPAWGARLSSTWVTLGKSGERFTFCNVVSGWNGA